MTHCPDPETIARYVEGGLEPAERRDVEHHAASCDRCYVTLRESARYHHRERPRRWTRTRARALGAVAAALLVVLAASGIWVTHGREDPRRDIVLALQESGLPGRMTFGRTSLAAPYAPWQGRQRALEEVQQSPGYWRVLHATSAIHSRASDGSAKTETLRGIAYLVAGDGDHAVESLERARLDGKATADLLADLSAAYLQIAVTTDEPAATQSALAWATRALAIDPDHPAARFNRALALEHQGLVGQAEHAWEEYLRIDAESGWADEARQRIRDLRRSGASGPTGDRPEDPPAEVGDLASWAAREPQAARSHLQRELMPRWGRSVLDADDRAAALAMDRALRIADGLDSGRGPDAFASLVRESRDRARRDPGAARLDAEAHVAFAEGHAALDRDLEEARAQFESAASLWQRAGSGWERWARVWSAYPRWYLEPASRDAVIADLEAIRDGVDPETQPLLLARAAWFRALFATQELRHDLAIPGLRRAFAIYDEAGESDHAMFVAFLTAESYAYLGDSASAWEWIDRSLAAGKMRRDAPRYSRSLIGIGALVADIGEPEVAIAFLDEALARDEDPIDRFDASRRRASLLRDLGRRDEAKTQIARAEEIAATLAPGPLRERMDQVAILDRAELSIPDDPEHALELIEALRDRAGGESSDFLELQMLLVEAESAVRSGDAARTRDLLRRTIALQRRGGISDFFARTRRIQELALVADWTETHDPEAALLAAERARRGPRDPEVDDDLLSRSRSALPPDTAVVYFEVLENTTLSWVLRRDGLEAYPLPVGRERLRTMVERAADVLRTGGSSPRSLGELAETLAPPLRAALAGGAGELVIVPDEILFEAPFAALPMDADETPLGARAPLALAFDLSFLHDRSPEPFPAESGLGPVLVLADPALDPTLFPHLSALPHAREEAEAIARIEPGARVVTGPDASGSLLRRLAPGQSVIHLATHAIPNPRRPDRSILPLATTDGEGPLFATDIESLSLLDTRLVVLSSCGSAETGRGAGGLARAFLRAGASNVIGAGWEVRDRPASSLLQDFYRRLRHDRDPVRALHEARLAFHRAFPSDPTWAAFQIYRGS